jgi:hypothetical protein
MQELLANLKEEPLHVTLSVEAIERFRGCRDTLATGVSV